MNFTTPFRKLLLLAFFLIYTSALFAQVTRVTGIVTDATTKEAMPFVAVGFNGTSIGAPTDNDGRYTISSDKPYGQIKATFIGYKDVILNVKPGETQTVNIRMVPINQQLGEVEVKGGKKPRYRNKGNPAV